MLKVLSAPTKPRSAQVVSPQPVEEVARLRKADPVNYLLPTSLKWLKSLPEDARPVALATNIAHGPQQVNNTVEAADSRAGKMRNPQNKLSESNNELLPD